ncbi:hypothetical protein PgNI_05935, partial [Pyricularia grisea]|uniref:Uncharacterized protein n=1 Tax=Pyricularia grisea TaxID=148305 RepID=A0A6P8B6H3_PYRGI
SSVLVDLTRLRYFLCNWQQDYPCHYCTPYTSHSSGNLGRTSLRANPSKL